jgi:hypothetical protein
LQTVRQKQKNCARTLKQSALPVGDFEQNSFDVALFRRSHDFKTARFCSASEFAPRFEKRGRLIISKWRGSQSL